MLQSFSGSNGIVGVTDGEWPYAGLTLGADANFYGTTYSGGKYNQGSFFTITAEGIETLLYSFSGSSGIVGIKDGAQPQGSLLLGSNGNFYGTTGSGGAGTSGIVFEITTAGAETQLYAFCPGGPARGCADGEAPLAGLIQDGGGNLYGTTALGGAYNKGTVFKLTPAGVETVLHSFSGNGGIIGSADGADPYAGLMQGSDGNYYGTTYSGGKYNQGAIFKITPGGTETIVYSFSGTSGISGIVDGAQPQGGLIQGSDGNLYGTTVTGGAYNVGTVFKLTNVFPAP